MKIISALKAFFEKRIRAVSGESIAEALMGLLIASLGIVLLIGMITASVNLVTKSDEMLSEYVESENSLASKSDGTGISGKVTLNIGGSRAVKLTDDDDSKDISVIYYKNTTVGGHTVVSYRAKNEDE